MSEILKANKQETHQLITVRKNKYNSRRVQTINSLPSKTQQQFQEQVNVNNIMKKYHQGKPITHLNNKQGVFADISTAQDYFDSFNTILKAEEAFNQLPSAIRTKFNNDPAELLEFVHNPSNYDEGVMLGIFDAKLPPLTQNPSSPKPTPTNNDDSTTINNSTPNPSPKKTQN